MVQINQLSGIDDISSGDQLLLFSTANGDSRRSSVNNFQKYMQNNLNFGSQGVFTTQYALNIIADPYIINITDGLNNNTNVLLIFSVAAQPVDGTIVLPLSSGLADKQEILIIPFLPSSGINTVTIDGNGVPLHIPSNPLNLTQFARMHLRYDSNINRWFNVI